MIVCIVIYGYIYSIRLPELILRVIVGRMDGVSDCGEGKEGVACLEVAWV